MSDTIELLRHSLIQHGSLNNRIYLMSLDKRDHPMIFSLLDKIAEKNQYTKIFAKVPQWAVNEAEQNGYVIEAMIPGLFTNLTDGFFLGKFLDGSREKINRDVKETIRKVAEKSLEYKDAPITNKMKKKATILQLTTHDAINLAKLYGCVFDTYPFPIHDHYHIQKMMDEHVLYFGIMKDNQLVAASAAEMNSDQGFVEMTDFATIPEERGNNYALFLLQHMEKEMIKKNIHTVFTISRAVSYGMNITFAKAGYTYAGLLKNNTAINGNLESMNVLYKKI